MKSNSSDVPPSLTSAEALLACALERYAETNLPTRSGLFKVIVFREPGPIEHLAIVKGEVQGRSAVITRLHSECFTSEVLGSLKCDCREQLEVGLATIEAAGEGIVLYLRQEGRGIGLGNKIRAYALQESGVDTIEANVRLGFGVDERRYDVAAAMLKALGVHSIKLMTNNPEKYQQLSDHGIEIAARLPIEIAANPHSHSYLEVKRDKMGHWLRPEEGLPPEKT